MSDTSDLDAAIVTLLQNDATLHGLIPDGVYFAEAPPGLTRFAIVSVVDHVDADVFEGRAFEDALYLVKVVELSTVTPKNIKPACARVDALLRRAILTATGYVEIATAREGGWLHDVEVDAINTSIRWNHRGANYRITGTN
jgi:hypothetical protein